MTAWKHPWLGPIGPIPQQSQPKKVWKHLYAPEQHWERLCGYDIAELRAKAEAVVGVSRSEQRGLPRLKNNAKQILLQHHSEHYAPVYLSEMSSIETIWTPNMDSRHRHFALTPNAIFVVVALKDPESFIVTAFRPHPGTRNVKWSEEEIKRHAVEYFQSETDVKVDGSASRVAENLNRITEIPDTVNEVWWLASAVGHGRLLHSYSEVAEALPAAEKLLEAVPSQLRGEMKNALNWSELSSRLADALKESRPEELESVLADAEDLLAVSAAIGPDERCEAFLTEFEMLIPWIPSEWGHISERARLRKIAYGSEPSLVSGMWQQVEDSILSALVRESTPTLRPASTIADSLFPESRWQKFRDAIALLGTRSRATLDSVVSWIDESIANVNVTSLSPTMSEGEDEVVGTVHGEEAPNAPHYRVFIIDDDCTEIQDVTSRFARGDGHLWDFTSDTESATVAIFAGQSPILAKTLEEAILEAEKRSDVVVRAVEVYPTQTTKP